MSKTLRPNTAAEAGEMIAWAAAGTVPLSVVGRGTKAGLGNVTQSEHTLDLSLLSGITLYEPEELILQAKAGTPIAEIEAAVAEKNQMLAFEPPDLGPLLGAAPNTGSIGGTLACNLSGSRRFKAGAARDHFLSASAYSGRGELFNTGGRVVKNVTGYDLCKVLAGSYGTLAVMTDVTVKVLPAPEKARTVLVCGLDDDGGLHAMTQGLLSALEVSGAAHIPATLTSRSTVDYVARCSSAVTALRIEGPARSVEDRCAALRKILSAYGKTEELHSRNSTTFWKEIGDAHPFENESRAIWRISVAPQAGARAGALIRTVANAECYYDWGGGLMWAAVPPEGDIGAKAVRNAVAQVGGGHATLIRAPEDLRGETAAFQPQSAAMAALHERIKSAFDPKGILNPGRFAVSV